MEKLRALGASSYRLFKVLLCTFDVRLMNAAENLDVDFVFLNIMIFVYMSSGHY